MLAKIIFIILVIALVAIAVRQGAKAWKEITKDDDNDKYQGS